MNDAPPRPTCISCKFFEVDPAMSTQNMKQGLVGGCHRFPPVTTMSSMGHGQMGVKTTFPIVQQANWCGEHKINLGAVSVPGGTR